VINIRQFEECKFEQRGETSLTFQDSIFLAEIKLYYGLIELLHSSSETIFGIISFIETWKIDHEELCSKS
jgi:hypothetical protein